MSRQPLVSKFGRAWGSMQTTNVHYWWAGVHGTAEVRDTMRGRTRSLVICYVTLVDFCPDEYA